LEAELSEAERSRLPAEDFAVPHKRMLPIHDLHHARLAWDMLDRTHGLEHYEREDARHRIARALHRMGHTFGEGTEAEARRQLADGEGGRALEAVVIDEANHVVEVTIARPGTSQNGYIYSESVLREATPLWNGAPAFLDHPTALDLTRAGSRSLRDLVGVYEAARYEPGRGIRAHLRLSGNDHGAYATIREAIEAKAGGRVSPPVGISADWRLLRAPAPPAQDGKPRWQVQSVLGVNSGDLVIRPSAGGSFDRIVEATVGEPVYWGANFLGGSRGEGEGGALGGSGAAAAGSAGAGVGVAGASASAPGAGGAAAAAAAGGGVGVREGVTVDAAFQSAVDRAVEAALAPMRSQFAGAQLEAKLTASGLPEAAKVHLRKQFAGRVFESSEVDGAIDGLRGLLGTVFGQSSIRGVGGSILDPGVRQGITPLDKVQAAFDRLFGLPVPTELAGVPRLTGIREAYVLVTGDKFFDGRYHWEESIVRESNEVTTSVLANVVLNSMTKRLIRDYQAQPKWWEPFTIKVPVVDMKQQNRIRLGDFASLSSVSEEAAYQNAAWGDARENYTPTKFGNLVVVTLETFLNDDLHAIVRIPTKIAHAAVVTINEQVANLFTQSSGTGPTMSDTYHVFDASNHQGNTSTSSTYDLSSSALQSAMTVLEKMQNTASKRIGVRGKYLLIPPDLRWTAAVITQSQYASGTANNDINPLAGAIVPIVVPQFTTAYQWYLLADPAQIESIEIGFLNGREEPELLVQDNPTVGNVFTNDAISYKVRHIYGLGWLDYRGAFAALPTS
jgi:hypothetical protein